MQFLMQPHFKKWLMGAVSVGPPGYSHAQVPKCIDQLRYPKAVLDIKGVQALGNMPSIS